MPLISYLVREHAAAATAAIAATAATAAAAATTNIDLLPANRSTFLRNLCLNSYYSLSSASKKPEISFDIDSTYYFPQGLAVAKNGIRINATTTIVLNLTASIYFAICTT